MLQADLTTGMNVLYWKTMVIDTEGQMRKPILIKRIEVSGENIVTVYVLIVLGLILRTKLNQKFTAPPPPPKEHDGLKQ